MRGQLGQGREGGCRGALVDLGQVAFDRLQRGGDGECRSGSALQDVVGLEVGTDPPRRVLPRLDSVVFQRQGVGDHTRRDKVLHVRLGLHGVGLGRAGRGARRIRLGVGTSAGVDSGGGEHLEVVAQILEARIRCD